MNLNEHLGLPSIDDIPLDVRQKLLAPATAKQISLHWLCDVYRWGRDAALRQPTASPVAPTVDTLRQRIADALTYRALVRILGGTPDMSDDEHREILGDLSHVRRAIMDVIMPVLAPLTPAETPSPPTPLCEVCKSGHHDPADCPWQHPDDPAPSPSRSGETPPTPDPTQTRERYVRELRESTAKIGARVLAAEVWPGETPTPRETP